MRTVVPGKQHTNWNNMIRRLTPDRVAFGRCFKAKPSHVVSSSLVKLSRDLGQGFCYPIGVMYERIICCCQIAAFDPHEKEVGKK